MRHWIQDSLAPQRWIMSMDSSSAGEGGMPAVYMNTRGRKRGREEYTRVASLQEVYKHDNIHKPFPPAPTIQHLEGKAYASFTGLVYNAMQSVELAGIDQDGMQKLMTSSRFRRCMLHRFTTGAYMWVLGMFIELSSLVSDSNFIDDILGKSVEGLQELRLEYIEKHKQTGTEMRNEYHADVHSWALMYLAADSSTMWGNFNIPVLSDVAKNLAFKVMQDRIAEVSSIFAYHIYPCEAIVKAREIMLVFLFSSTRRNAEYARKLKMTREHASCLPYDVFRVIYQHFFHSYVTLPYGKQIDMLRSNFKGAEHNLMYFW